jgi:folate-binding protein YgfZ
VSEPNTEKTANLETPLAGFERAEGAEFAEYFGIRLPAQFGDPLAEYAVARDSVALIDTNFRAIFSLTGPDRVRYLNAVTSRNIRDLAPGQSALGLLLNAQGHMLAELLTLALEDRLLVLGHAFVRRKTYETLDKFIIMDDATLADETERTGTLAIEGAKTPEVLQELARVDYQQLVSRGHVAAVLKLPSAAIPCRILCHSLFGLPGVELLLPRESLYSAWQGLAEALRTRGGAPIGYRAIDMLRLEAGIPWFGTDFDEHRIPQEARIGASHISFNKGCYTGQEIVERVRSRGHVNWQLTGLLFDSAEAPVAGTAVLAEDATEAGHITSAAFSPLAGKGIGMAYLRLKYQQPGTKLRCGTSGAEVIEIPLRAAMAIKKLLAPR